jgi:hypothetical protein
MDGQVYNLITAAELQVNAYFVFLSEGECPVREGGHRADNCWSHPGSYFGRLSVQTAQGDRLLIEAGAASKGFTLVHLNGRPVPIGQAVGNSPHLSVFQSSGHLLTIRTPLLTVEVENSDLFLNLLSVSPSSLRALAKAEAHGLLGQTWRRPAVKGSDVAEIEGTVDDYAVLSNDMFDSQFIYNKFTPQQA